MIIPIRCFTCGKVVANNWNKYEKLVGEGQDPNRVLNDMGYMRYCCRRMFITNVDMMDVLLMYDRPEKGAGESN